MAHIYTSTKTAAETAEVRISPMTRNYEEKTGVELIRDDGSMILVLSDAEAILLISKLAASLAAKS